MGRRILVRFALFVLLGPGVFSQTRLHSQEVAFIDLTQIEARMELRRPPAPAGAPEAHGGSQAEFYGCKGGGPMKGALRTTLVALDRAQYQIGDSPVFEVTVENIGTQPLRIPISPHLADLQPPDPGQKFGFSELIVTLWLGGREWSTTSAVVAKLYGRNDHPDTMLRLQPGEWARIVAKDQFGLHFEDEQIRRLRREDPVDHANAATRVAQTTMLLAPTASASVRRTECLISRPGPDIPVTVSEAQQ